MAHLNRRNAWSIRLLTYACILSPIGMQGRVGAQDGSLPQPVFLATYDEGTDAVTAQGSQSIMTAASLKREKILSGNHHTDVNRLADGGKYGGYLQFKRKGNQVLFYQAQGLPLFDPNWSGTISFWLRLNPDEDLAPGYCDPIQITSKAWNDAAIWVDFDKDLPRVFRMGAFPDYDQWNPDDTKWEEVAAVDRPLIPVTRPPFDRERWTHVAMTIEGVNAPADRPGMARLFLDGKLQGEMKRPFPMTLDPQETVVMIGINYVGGMDELAIFDTALSPEAVKSLYQLPKGLDR